MPKIADSQPPAAKTEKLPDGANLANSLFSDFWPHELHQAA